MNNINDECLLGITLDRLNDVTRVNDLTSDTPLLRRDFLRRFLGLDQRNHAASRLILLDLEVDHKVAAGHHEGVDGLHVPYLLGLGDGAHLAALGGKLVPLGALLGGHDHLEDLLDGRVDDGDTLGNVEARAEDGAGVCLHVVLLDVELPALFLLGEFLELFKVKLGGKLRDRHF